MTFGPCCFKFPKEMPQRLGVLTQGGELGGLCSPSLQETGGQVALKEENHA